MIHVGELINKVNGSWHFSEPTLGEKFTVDLHLYVDIYFNWLHVCTFLHVFYSLCNTLQCFCRLDCWVIKEQNVCGCLKHVLGLIWLGGGTPNHAIMSFVRHPFWNGPPDRKFILILTFKYKSIEIFTLTWCIIYIDV